MNKALKYIVVSIIFFGHIDISEASDFTRLLSDPNYLINEVRKAEENMNNITADIDVWAEERANTNDSWQKNPLISFSTRVWMDGSPGGKIRIDVNGEKAIWHKNNESVVLERDYSLSYDGKQGMELLRRESRDGKEYDRMPEGRIFSHKPQQLYSKNLIFASGMRLTLNHFFISDECNIFGNSFSGLLTLNQQARLMGEPSYDITMEVYMGIKCIKIRTPLSLKKMTEIWWLDPNRSFLLVGYMHKSIRNGIEWIGENIQVMNAVEAAPGIWFPVEAICVSEPSFATNWKYRKCFYKAKNIQINLSDLDKNTYRINFPEKARVVTEVPENTN